MNSHGEKYTILSMTIRIPSSLKWLINQYQNQSRKLRDIELQIEQLSAQRSIIIGRMESFEKVIEFHDVPITVEDLPELKSNQKQTPYKYGEVTKLIYKCLGSIPEHSCVTITDVVNFCLAHSEMLNVDSEIALRMFRKAIQKRLKNLAYLGKITRVELGTKSCEPRYRANSAD